MIHPLVYIVWDFPDILRSELVLNCGGSHTPIKSANRFSTESNCHCAIILLAVVIARAASGVEIALRTK